MKYIASIAAIVCLLVLAAPAQAASPNPIREYGKAWAKPNPIREYKVGGVYRAY